MDVPVLTAVIGVGGALIGTIVGGCLTMFSNFFLNKRRERAEFRMACRLIALELEEKDAFLRTMADKKRWWQFDLPMTVGAWEDHRHILASYLSDEEWRDVRTAIRATRLFDIIAATARQEKTEVLTDDHVQTLVGFAEDMAKAQRSLQPYLTK
jgi:hypothetical protein